MAHIGHHHGERGHDHGDDHAGAHRHDHRHHGRGHGGHGGTGGYGWAFAIGTAINLGFVAAEGAAGFLSGSLALLADAGHNLVSIEFGRQRSA